MIRPAVPYLGGRDSTPYRHHLGDHSRCRAGRCPAVRALDGSTRFADPPVIRLAPRRVAS
jgi:hypothetical protein